VGQNKGGAVKGGNHVGHGKGFATAGYAQQYAIALVLGANKTAQIGNCTGLIARRRKAKIGRK
jgi:hypothetical protein